MDKLVLGITFVLATYGAIMSTINYLKDKKGGKITENGVISPKGKEIVKKKTR